MKRIDMLGVSVFVMVLVAGVSPAVVFADSDAVETGRLLAVLHDSGQRPVLYCGHIPWTTNPNLRGPLHCGSP